MMLAAWHKASGHGRLVVGWLAVAVALYLPVAHIATLIHLASEPHVGYVLMVTPQQGVNGRGSHWHGHHHHRGHSHHHHGGHSHHAHHHHHHGHHHQDHSHHHGHHHQHGPSSGAGSDKRHHHTHGAADHLVSLFFLASPYVIPPLPPVEYETLVLYPPDRIRASQWEAATRPRAPPSGACLTA